MATLLQIDFPHVGPFGAEMAEELAGLAKSIAEEPGLIWKIWTENEGSKLGGGVYLFHDESAARNYLEMHSKRLRNFGVNEVNAKIFDVNRQLSAITRGPLD